MAERYRTRRSILVLIVLACAAWLMSQVPIEMTVIDTDERTQPSYDAESGAALAQLDALDVKGRAPKTDYTRAEFGSGWSNIEGCDTRNTILYRDLVDTQVGATCLVQKGTLHDPYTGNTIFFVRSPDTSSLVQIDHVVALSDAWQKGAQQLSHERRVELANDPLNLLAVDGSANQAKSDGDAATWLPPRKAFRCQYVARQIAVKAKYDLWVTSAEKDAMKRILAACPGQAAISTT